MPKITESELSVLLSKIPNNTEAFNIVLWLRQYVPIISSLHPNIMPHITDWSIEKTRSLQYSQHWPEIGMEFCTKVMNIYEEIKFLHS